MKTWIFLLACCSLGIDCDILATQTGNSDHADKAVKEGIVGMLDTVTVALDDVPYAGNIAKLASPLLKFLLNLETEKENVELKAIQDGFREISNKLDKYIGQIMSELGNSKMRDIRTKANVLMKHLDAITLANSAVSRNVTIQDFLKNCKDYNPFVLISELEEEVEKVLSLQLEHDPEHSNKTLMSMEHKLYGILHELTFATVFEEVLLNKTEQQIGVRSMLLDVKIGAMKNKTLKVLKNLLDINYSSKTEKAIRNILENNKKENSNKSLNDRASSIWELLKDIYTTERFCLLVSPQRQEADPISGFAVFSGNDLRSLEEGFNVYVLRSQSAHNMTDAESTAFDESVRVVNAKFQRCPLIWDSEPFKYEIWKQPYSIIMPTRARKGQGTVLPTDVFFKCDSNVIHNISKPCITALYDRVDTLYEMSMYVVPH